MKTAYKSPFLQVYLENFKIKKRKINNFHKIIMNNATMVVLENKDNKVLIVNEYRRAFKKVVFGFPGGHIEKNEKPLTAIKRELKEECGYVGKNWKLLFSYTRSGSYGCGKEFVYTAKLKGEVKNFIKSEEIDTLKWISKKQLLNLILKKKSTSGIISSVFYYLYKKSRFEKLK